MKILVTGAAGYIGKKLVEKLISENHKVIAHDIIPTGFNNEIIHDLTKKCDFLPEVDIVIHLAAHKSVPESIEKPTKYLENISMTLNLVQHYHDTHIIFSSTAAVYKEGSKAITENGILEPQSPYGHGKLACENIIRHNPKHTILRYFNVIGDYPGAKKGTNILDILQDCSLNNKTFSITGTDFNTKDGTGVRDYIDLNDIIEAHLKVFKPIYGTFNVGNEKGVSVKELVEIYKETYPELKVENAKRRQGDIGYSVADTKLFHEKSGWKPKISIKESVNGYINLKK